jgi:HAD superfamily hydrolase (TIGR01662 family)
MENFRALVCDLDMTLLESRQDIAASLAWAANFHGAAELTKEDVYPFIGKGLLTAVGALMPDADHDKIVATYKERFFDHCDVHSYLYPGVTQTLAELSEKGVRIAIATAKMTFMATHVCRVFGLDQLVDYIQGTDDLPGKPDPAIVLAACKQIQVPPEETIFIGDTVMDVQAGKRAGCRALAVTYGIGKKEALALEDPYDLLDEFTKVKALFS